MDKKGKGDNTIVILLIIGAIIYFLSQQSGGANTSGGTTVINNGGSGSSALENLVKGTIQTTVVLGSWDAYSTATDAGDAHRILALDGRKNEIVADDASTTGAPGWDYEVLLGNATTAIGATIGNAYYPTLMKGNLPSAKDYTISAGQYHIDTAPGFRWQNSQGTANTAQPLTTSDTKTVTFWLSAADNQCYGNKDVKDGKNVMCLGYNTTVYDSVELINGVSASKPKSITDVTSDEDFSCYYFDVLCDNDEKEYKMLIKTDSTTQPSTAAHNISISLSDVSYDFDADTLALISGVEDEDRNDIGQDDIAEDDRFGYASSISVS